jgi:hypothetical protein
MIRINKNKLELIEFERKQALMAVEIPSYKLILKVRIESLLFQQ